MLLFILSNVGVPPCLTNDDCNNGLCVSSVCECNTGWSGFECDRGKEYEQHHERWFHVSLRCLYFFDVTYQCLGRNKMY